MSTFTSEYELDPSTSLFTHLGSPTPQLQSACLICNTTTTKNSSKPVSTLAPTSTSYSNVMTKLISYPKSHRISEYADELNNKDWHRNELNLDLPVLNQVTYCSTCADKISNVHLVFQKLEELQEQIRQLQYEFSQQIQLQLQPVPVEPTSVGDDDLNALRQQVVNELNLRLNSETLVLVQAKPYPEFPVPILLPDCYVKLEKLDQVNSLRFDLDMHEQFTSSDLDSYKVEFDPLCLSPDVNEDEEKPDSELIHYSSSNLSTKKARRPTKSFHESAVGTGTVQQLSCKFPQCDQISATPCQLSEHVRNNHFQSPSAVFLCHICGAFFPNQPNELERHCLLLHNFGRYECKYCPKSFGHLSTLRKHHKDNHSTHFFVNPLKKSKPDPKHQPEALICDYCGKQNQTRHSHVSHIRSHVKPHKCSVPGCNASFSAPSNLRYHQCRKHPELQIPGFQCPQCPRILNRRDTLKFHIKVCHNHEYKAKCDVEGCNFQTMYPDRLKWHTASVHTKIRNFLCTECGAAFYFNEKLRIHMRTQHTDEKPFECKHCHKRFARGDNIRRHEAIHGKEKPFSCELCGLKFPTRNNLSGHIRSHHVKKGAGAGVRPKRKSKYEEEKQPGLGH